MELRTYLDAMSEAERRAFARKAGTTPAYLHQLRFGCKRPGPGVALKIHEASGKRVHLSALRPDIWGNGRAA